MMKCCSVMFVAVMFANCVAVWAVDDAATVLADMLVLSVAAAAAVTIWKAVVELPAAAASAASVTAAACFAVAPVAVAVCFAVKRVCGSAAEHAAE